MSIARVELHSYCNKEQSGALSCYIQLRWPCTNTQGITMYY